VKSQEDKGELGGKTELGHVIHIELAKNFLNKQLLNYPEPHTTTDTAL
jgi:hypothetical protein